LAWCVEAWLASMAAFTVAQSSLSVGILWHGGCAVHGDKLLKLVHCYGFRQFYVIKAPDNMPQYRPNSHQTLHQHEAQSPPSWNSWQLSSVWRQSCGPCLMKHVKRVRKRDCLRQTVCCHLGLTAVDFCNSLCYNTSLIIVTWLDEQYSCQQWPLLALHILVKRSQPVFIISFLAVIEQSCLSFDSWAILLAWLACTVNLSHLTKLAYTTSQKSVNLSLFVLILTCITTKSWLKW